MPSSLTILTSTTSDTPLDMSSDTSDAEIIEIYSSVFSGNMYIVASVALVFYEYMITFDSEVRLVWGKKTTGANVLFALNRYSMVFQSFVNLATLFPLTTDKGCAIMGYFAEVFQLLPMIIWASFSSLRTYALSGRNRTLGLLVFILSLVPLGTNTYTFTQRTFFLEPPPIYCALSDGPPAAVTARLVTATRVCLIVADALVLFVTWWNTFHVGKTAAQANLRSSLAVALLQNGTAYFVILLIFNVIHIALTLGEQFTYLILLESPVSSILISRFILNLRDVDTTSGNIELDTRSPSFVRSHVPNTLAFAPGFVESMGVSLHLGPRSSEECSTVSTSDLHAVGDEGEYGAMDLSVIDINAEGHVVEDVHASCSWGSTL